MQISNLAPVVVVEDNDEDFETFALAFGDAGGTNEVKRCCDGKEAIDYLFGDTEMLSPPSLVILDLNLPGIDGRTVLSRIKSHEKLRRIPVVVLTTSANPKDIDYCYAQGANCYTLKPVDLPRFERLVALIKEFWLDNAVLPNNPDVLTPA